MSEEWRRDLEAFIAREGSVVSHHQARFVRGRDRDELMLHLIVDKGMSVEDSHRLCHRLEEWMNERYSSCKVIVHFEPCINDCHSCEMTCHVTTG